VYEFFEHSADVGIRVRAETLAELLSKAAAAVFAAIVANPQRIRAKRQIALRVEGEEHDLLLFDWLSELLYLFEVQPFVCCAFDVSLRPGGSTAWQKNNR